VPAGSPGAGEGIHTVCLFVFNFNKWPTLRSQSGVFTNTIKFLFPRKMGSSFTPGLQSCRIAAFRGLSAGPCPLLRHNLQVSQPYHSFLICVSGWLLWEI
jgi:hypothetical protein